MKAPLRAGGQEDGCAEVCVTLRDNFGQEAAAAFCGAASLTGCHLRAASKFFCFERKVAIQRLPDSGSAVLCSTQIARGIRPCT